MSNCSQIVNKFQKKFKFFTQIVSRATAGTTGTVFRDGDKLAPYGYTGLQDVIGMPMLRRSLLGAAESTSSRWTPSCPRSTWGLS